MYISVCVYILNNQFSLLAVVMFCKVTENTDSSLLGKCRVRFLQACSHIFINQSMYNLVLWIFLFKDTLLNMYCWLTNIELRANSSVTPAWVKLIWHTRHITVFLCFKTLDHNSALCLGAISNREITMKVQKCKKKMTVNSLQKGHLFRVWELKWEGNTWPCMTLGICTLSNSDFSPHMHKFTNDHKGIKSIDLGGRK